MRGYDTLDRQRQRVDDLALRVRDWYNDDDDLTYDYDHIANNYYNHAGHHDHYDDYDIYDINDRAYYIDHRGRLYHYDDIGGRVYYHYRRIVRQGRRRPMRWRGNRWGF